ncbi:MAG: 50S ribosomal protein L15 [Candidatus Nomurabacteria bacterium]|jgi:large subunit ribosomal protein L15|nr:50S ribosomal protein L15 [Candidatus Nomurabacteria bacterium]
MKFNELEVAAKPSRKRIGRGISAGQGKTAGRGTKGQKARTGHSKMRATFMGGQRSIMQAVPKLKGFKSLHKAAEVVYLDQLNGIAKADNFTLAEAGLTSSPFVRVKVIARGELKSKVELKVQFASKTAVAAVEKAGGKFVKTAVPMREAVKTTE